MAIKERLLKQLNIVQDGLHAMPPFHSRDLNAMRNALLQARDLCFRGLSESRFAEYKDTYDGLLLALEQLATDAPDEDEIVSLCSDLLQYMITQTQKETSFKKEIFFLPYKASMWDSLESVWRAADEDKAHCIAYVMPIPYADLTPEHTVAEWHCERDQFPKDVPTVKWEDFNLEEITPDVIFIHNPYDEYNRVTSVESRYFSSKLKGQTDKLVYIPYFVLAEPEFEGKSEEEIETMEEGIAHFVTTPAVLNAHQVIVQSEAMRRVYIDVLTKRTNQTERTFWEKRILGMGSPKFDKVAMTKQEELDIPDEWLKIIQKPDGSWKKIVFYNTGLSAMLQHNEKMLAKIRQVFRTFQEHQDEVALLWRPHPLLQATLKSMRPELAEEYDGIVTRYNAEGWGIYDDSADMNRAIVLSNAYYGDGSSVVELYRKTGKPVIIEDITTVDVTQEDILCLNFVSGVHKEDGFYFPAWNTNGLFRVREDWTDTKRIDFFPNQEIATRFLYSKIIEYNGVFYFIPTNGKNILSYEIGKKKWGCFLLDETKIQTAGPQFTNAHLIDNKIWLKPYCAHAIVSFTPHNAQIFYYSDWFREIEKEIGNEEGPLFGGDALVGTKLYFTFRLGNKVICFDTQEKTHLIYSIGASSYKFETMTFDGSSFWIYSQNGDLLQWDGTQTILRTYENLFGDRRASAGLLWDDGCLWVISSNKDDFACINIHTGEIEMHRGYLGGEIDIGYPSLAKRGNEILLYPNQGKYLIRIDKSTKKATMAEIFQTTDDYREMVDFFSKSLKKSLSPNEIVYEPQLTHTSGLEDFYETFFNLVGERQERKVAFDLCGANILHYVLSR